MKSGFDKQKVYGILNVISRKKVTTYGKTAGGNSVQTMLSVV